MNYLYLKAASTEEVDVFLLTTESYVALFLWQLLGSRSDVKLMLINSAANLLENDKLKKLVPVNLPRDAQYELVNTANEDDDSVRKLPYLVMNSNHYLIGLCSVLRGLCRSKSLSSTFAYQLLGFKENCLLAPSECSPWTRFCEREMISCCEMLLRSDERAVEMPEELAKLERDLGNPIRIHNIHKYLREMNEDKSIKSIENTKIEHKFCHGNEMYLSDVILYSLVKVIYTLLLSPECLDAVPMTRRWLDTIEADENNFLNHFNHIINFKLFTRTLPGNIKLVVGELDDSQKGQHSDNQRDTAKVRNQHNRNKKQFTKQSHIDAIMEKLKCVEVEIVSQPGDANQSHVNDALIKDLLTQGGLPEKRMENKTAQLKSLASEVAKLARSDDVIVDFCSGTGHLGLLVAHLLPNCSIIILENKEESVSRAIKRAEQLRLNNVTFYQCNLVSSDIDTIFIHK